MLSLDQWAVRLAARLQADIANAYENYQFHTIYQRLHQFCVVEMGGFYLDILKDRLYTMPKTSQARLSAQTAMQHILEVLVRELMPILSFTAEEIWGHMNGEREQSLLFATRYSALDKVPDDAAGDQQWQNIINARNAVSKQIEGLRVEGKIGAALDVHVDLFADGDLADSIKPLGDELRFVLITSEATLADKDKAPENAATTELDSLKVLVKPLDNEKCVRCWHRRPDIGQNSSHPKLCLRCVTNIDNDGVGETRRFV